MSHYGALQRGRPTDPEGWAFNPRVCRKVELRAHWWKFATIDPLSYFDPGNRHYAECFHALFGKTPGWNDETIGDMIESLLGLQFVATHRRDYPALGIKANDIDLIKEKVPLAFAHFIHDWCRAVFRLRQATAWKKNYADLFARIKADAEMVQMKINVPSLKRQTPSPSTCSSSSLKRLKM